MSDTDEALRDRLLLGRPDHRNNGKYQFVTGWTGGGAEMCVHVDPADVSARCVEKFGPGTFVDDGVDLWWDQTGVPGDQRKRPPLQWHSQDGWRPAERTCPACGGRYNVRYRLIDSACGGHTDEKYECRCGYKWRVDGADA